MLPFLKKYLQQANRNQNIIISLGEKKNDYIFNNIIDKKKAHNIINFINKTYRLKKKYYQETLYQKGNEEIKTIEKELMYVIVKDLDYTMCDSYLFKWRKYNKDTIVIPSHTEYDNISVREILEFIIDNSFTIRIIISNNIYNIDVVANKPCITEKLQEFLHKIESL